MKKISIIILIFLCFTSIRGQISVIQDGEGETSFQLFKSNSITLNAEKSSIGFSITPKEYSNMHTKYWTITALANAKNGVSNLFKNGDFQLSGRLGTNLIFDKTNYANGNLIYQFLGSELLYSRNNVFDASREFKNQIFDETNIGFRINYGWNLQNVKFKNQFLKYLGEFTSGISISIGVKDNTDIIDPNEIVTSTQTITNGTTIRTVTSSSDAYDINQLISNQKFSRLNFDFGKHFFYQRLYANFHMTYAIDEDFKPVLNPSIGLFIIKKGAPLEAVVGLQIQTSDWSNSRASEKDRWERSGIILTAGFPFN